MNVLSLFDGMSCGRIALERAGIKVDSYYASEIDKHAMTVAKANWPENINLGDVQHINYQMLPQIDLVIGGSPCQGFSFAGKQLNFSDPRSALFFEFVHAVRELKPKYFMLENVKMKKEHLQVITEQLGVEPILINSSLVSAQNRQRYYWTNIPGVTQPEDKGIVLADIIQESVSDEFFYSEKSIAYMERGNEKWQQAGDRRADRYLQTPEKEKAFTLTANFHKGVPYNYFLDSHISVKQLGRGNNKGFEKPMLKSPSMTSNAWEHNVKVKSVEDSGFRKLTPIECERLQTVPDNYTNHVSNTQRYKMLGNGWTVDVIAHIFKNMDA